MSRVCMSSPASPRFHSGLTADAADAGEREEKG
eukprot:CAMPEP_0118972734 /NCGR_PEP_ID=MMETSP1173-20130426/8957_1 /TAXON_ID=1034831 /ORGANISM="Rhizochromulina marina cf, Strain CCMP1243" /LENGTH=32 /DNA_ID= /DNA_START= /DNA_END= /DNA_ORIENTATION=